MKQFPLKFVFLTLALVLVAGVMAFAASQIEQEKVYRWRYKMTVEIDTPEGVRTGSAVREVTVTFRPKGHAYANESKYIADKSLKGEAVVVDLGERGKVFALLVGPYGGTVYGSTIAFDVFNGPPGLTIEGAKYYSNLKDKKIIEPTYYPMFVTFKNIKDPSSVLPLIEFKSNDKYPRTFSIADNYFEKHLGEGVNLKSVTIEMTGEPVSLKIVDYLPWLQDYYNKRLDGNKYGTSEAENQVANGLSSGAFLMGENQ